MTAPAAAPAPRSDHGAAVTAGFLGWTLDAFDFFLVVMCLTAIAKEFGKSDAQIAFSLTLTLIFRPVGALIFGLLADRYGRRLPLMIDLVFYSLIEVLTGFAPSFTTFLVLRALFGIGMGGEWGVGASLVMEKVPPRLRGVLSGLLQQGYAAGYLLAALCYFVVFPRWGWRPLFFIGGGRGRTIVVALGGALAAIPLWAFAPNLAVLVIGAFVMQFMVQGAWGVIPAHITELTPDSVRGFLPGFAYQCGACLAGTLPYLQARVAARMSYSWAMAVSAGTVFVLCALVAWLGRERRGITYGAV